MDANFFGEPFDEATKIKLGIYRAYVREWLPVWVKNGSLPINLFDFFAGKGQDSIGTLGSPLIAMEETQVYVDEIIVKELKVKLLFNEYNRLNFITLNQLVKERKVTLPFLVEICRKDFKVLFHERMAEMKGSANLLFLDQFGIKQITADIFSAITSLRQTDFIFFISSSFISRFKDHESFKKYLDTSKMKLDESKPLEVHRTVMEYYRSLIPAGKEYYLAPFSIKKGPNIYGLIFGSNHSFGIEKFLKVCWKMDSVTGQANFDLDTDRIDLQRPSLFPEFNVPKKLTAFENHLTKAIMAQQVQTNDAAYLYGLNYGVLPKHVNEVLKKLVKERRINYDFKLQSERIHNITTPQPINLLNHGRNKH